MDRLPAILEPVSVIRQLAPPDGSFGFEIGAPEPYILNGAIREVSIALIDLRQRRRSNAAIVTVTAAGIALDVTVKCDGIDAHHFLQAVRKLLVFAREVRRTAYPGRRRPRKG